MEIFNIQDITYTLQNHPPLPFFLVWPFSRKCGVTRWPLDSVACPCLEIAQIRSTTAAGNLSRKKRWSDKNRCGSIKICSAPLRSTELRGAERSGARPLTKLRAPHHTPILNFMFKCLKTQYKFVLLLSL